MPFHSTCQVTSHQGENKNVWSSDDRRNVPFAVTQFIVEKGLVARNKASKFSICEGCMSRIRLLMRQESSLSGPIPQPPSSTPQHSSPIPHQSTSIPQQPVTTREVSVSIPQNPAPILGSGESLVVSDLKGATDIVCNAIAQKTLPSELLSSLFYAMGKFIADELKATSSHKETARLDAVLTTSYTAMWNKTTPGAVFDILSSLGSSSSEDEETKCRKQVKILEQLLWLCCPGYISNVALGEAILLQQFAHSQKAIEIFGRCVPCGSYSTLKRTIGQTDKQATVLPPNDVVIAFDNNQTIMKTYMVKYFGKQLVSIVTSMIALSGGPLSKHQFQVQIPTALLPTSQNRQELLIRYDNFHDNSVRIHRECRQKFIENILVKVSNECKIREGKLEDPVSTDKIDENIYEEFFTYNRVPKVERAVPILDLDCLQVNPNSYKTVQHFNLH